MTTTLDSTSTAPATSSPRGTPVNRTIRVLLLISGLAGLGAAMLPPIGGAPLIPSLELPWWALTLGFVVAEIFVLNVQVRRESQSLSFSEIPLVIGLFLVAPFPMLVGRVLASGAVMILHRKSPPLKIAFNLALHLSETCAAIAIFGAISRGHDTASPLTWAAAYLGALGADVLGSLALASVIAVYEGAVRMKSLMRDLTAQAVPAMGVTIGLLAVLSLTASPASVWLLVAFGTLLIVAFRAYASLADRHVGLERLYRFSQAVSSAPEIDQVIGNLLTEARELLRSERAYALFVSTEDSLVARIALGPNGSLSRSETPLAEVDAYLVEQVITNGSHLLMPRSTREEFAREWLAAKGLQDAVVVPLGGGAGVVGILVVADRLGDNRSFNQDDVLMLETVGNHAAVALRNGELVGRMRHDALHDALTGLPNRTFLQRAIGTALDDVEAGRSPGVAVMLLDLDEFKAVNDTLGHEHGDQLLIEVGARLAAAVGKAGSVVRLGGDEFAAVLPATRDERRVLQIGRRMLRALEEPISLDGLEVEIGASVGIALAPEHADDSATLLKCADLAMYDAKTSRSGVRMYESELDASNPLRLTLVSELRTALQNGAIQVHVQPQAQLVSGEVVGVEALVRWEHPELGWISPDEFIPVAERSGLIGPLTSHVLDASLAACAQWARAGHEVGIAVNLSARSLHDADLVAEVERLLRRHGVPAKQLTLEVTEGSVMADPTRAVAVLHALRDLGVRLSVDDFGTGYSSLAYLQRLPVQEVKIDRSFVIGLGQARENTAIVRAIVDLGRALGLDVVAEGVEDADTWQLLAAMNCDLVQGWHLSRPMPIDALPAWLDAREQEPTGRTGLRVV